MGKQIKRLLRPLQVCWRLSGSSSRVLIVCYSFFEKAKAGLVLSTYFGRGEVS